MALPGTGSPFLITAMLAFQQMFGNVAAPRPYRQTAVRPYVEYFQTEAILHQNMTIVPRDLYIAFMKDGALSLTGEDSCPISYRIIGYCYHQLGQPIIILIDREYFEESDEELKISLVFHELGHCLLDRKHDDRQILLHGELKPISLMHSSMEPGDHFWRFYDYYMNELFTAGNLDPSVW